MPTLDKALAAMNAAEVWWASDSAAIRDDKSLSGERRKRARKTAALKAAERGLEQVVTLRKEFARELLVLRELRSMLPTIITCMDDVDGLSAGEAVTLRRLQEIDLEDWV
jgi:hypothetical protein